jgi:hypothetical protein
MVAEMERRFILERQRAAIEAAKKGVYKVFRLPEAFTSGAGIDRTTSAARFSTSVRSAKAKPHGEPAGRFPGHARDAGRCRASPALDTAERKPLPPELRAPLPPERVPPDPSPVLAANATSGQGELLAELRALPAPGRLPPELIPPKAPRRVPFQDQA